MINIDVLIKHLALLEIEGSYIAKNKLNFVWIGVPIMLE